MRAKAIIRHFADERRGASDIHQHNVGKSNMKKRYRKHSKQPSGNAVASSHPVVGDSRRRPVSGQW
jgi:hypothetical protein